MPLSIERITAEFGELQRRYLFKLIVESYPITVNIEFPRAKLVSESVDLLAQEGIWPARKTEDIEYKWSGEKVYFSGADATDKKFILSFAVDQRMYLLDFFEACKDLTGNLTNHAAVNKPNQVLTLGIYMVDVGKNTVTDYRGLHDARISSLETDALDKKNTSDLMILKIGGTWDRTLRDITKRGKSI